MACTRKSGGLGLGVRRGKIRGMACTNEATPMSTIYIRALACGRFSSAAGAAWAAWAAKCFVLAWRSCSKRGREKGGQG
eukprot:150109-Chlamydomonas_euryale.AAC.1